MGRSLKQAERGTRLAAGLSIAQGAVDADAPFLLS
jgi:hypothetical protein